MGNFRESMCKKRALNRVLGTWIAGVVVGGLSCSLLPPKVPLGEIPQPVNVPFKPDYGIFGPALQITEEPGKPPPLEHWGGVTGIAPVTDPNRVLVTVHRAWYDRWPLEVLRSERSELFRIRGPDSAVMGSLVLDSVEFREGNLPTNRVGGYGSWLRLSESEYMVIAPLHLAGSKTRHFSVLHLGADGTPIGPPRQVAFPPAAGTVIVLKQATLPDGSFVFLLKADDEDGYPASFTMRSRDGLRSLEGPYRVYKPGPEESDIWEPWIPRADMAVTPDGTLYILMLVGDHGKPRLFLFRSADGERWELVSRDVLPPEHYLTELLPVKLFADEAGVIHVLYLNLYGSVRNRQIMYRYSSDGGRNFSPPVNLLVMRIATPALHFPQIQVFGTRRYVLWPDDGSEFYDPERYSNPVCTAPPARLWLTWSDDGANFHPPVRISDIAEGYFYLINGHNFAIDGYGDLHIFWTTARFRKCGVRDPNWHRVYYLYVTADRVNALTNR